MVVRSRSFGSYSSLRNALGSNVTDFILVLMTARRNELSTNKLN